MCTPTQLEPIHMWRGSFFQNVIRFLIKILASSLELMTLDKLSRSYGLKVSQRLILHGMIHLCLLVVIPNAAVAVFTHTHTHTHTHTRARAHTDAHARTHARTHTHTHTHSGTHTPTGSTPLFITLVTWKALDHDSKAPAIQIFFLFSFSHPIAHYKVL